MAGKFPNADHHQKTIRLWQILGIISNKGYSTLRETFLILPTSFDYRQGDKLRTLVYRDTTLKVLDNEWKYADNVNFKGCGSSLS